METNAHLERMDVSLPVKLSPPRKRVRESPGGAPPELMYWTESDPFIPGVTAVSTRRTSPPKATASYVSPVTNGCIIGSYILSGIYVAPKARSTTAMATRPITDQKISRM